MNYIKAADKYIDQILLMKDMVKIKQTAEEIMNIEWVSKLKIGSYDELVKQYRKSEDRNIGTFKTAEQIVGQLFQDLDSKDKDQATALINLSTEDYQRLLSGAKALLDKEVNEKFHHAFMNELDIKFQKICVDEAKSIIDSLGPEPHEQTTKSKIQHIRDLCQSRTVPALCRTWRISCNRCKAAHGYALTEDQVRTLVHDGFLKLDTTQSIVTMLDLPYHQDLGRHEQTITLGQLVRQYLQSS